MVRGKETFIMTRKRKMTNSTKDESSQESDITTEGTNTKKSKMVDQNIISEDRRSSRIMTRKLNDSELRKQFIKKRNLEFDDKKSKLNSKNILRNPKKTNKNNNNNNSKLKNNITRRKQKSESEDTQTGDSEVEKINSNKNKLSKTKKITIPIIKSKQKNNNTTTEDDEYSSSDEDDFEKIIKQTIIKKSNTNLLLKKVLEQNLNPPNKNISNNNNKEQKKTNFVQKSSISNSVKINSIIKNNSKNPIISKKSKPTTTLQKPKTPVLINLDEDEEKEAPKKKTEFDKLVESLFEEEKTKQKLSTKIPEVLLIDNEPTDVYTLSVQDVDEEDDDYIESLCEEFYEEEAPAPTPFSNYNIVKNEINNKTVNAGVKNFNKPNLLNKTNLLNNIVSPIIPKTFIASTPSTNNLIMKNIPNKNNNTPNIKNEFKLNTNNKNSLQSSVNNNNFDNIKTEPSTIPFNTSSNSLDYKLKYDKLHQSYEVLSEKISMYMEKTRKEKEILKKEMTADKTKLARAYEEIELMKKKIKILVSKLRE